MSLVRVTNFSISLDGFAAGEPQSFESPFGHAGQKLHQWMMATSFWDPAGSTGVDLAFTAVLIAVGLTALSVVIFIFALQLRLPLLGEVPLLCAREMPVPGSLPRVIRLLLHYYGEPDDRQVHVYLREAIALRRDLEGAQ